MILCKEPERIAAPGPKTMNNLIVIEANGFASRRHAFFFFFVLYDSALAVYVPGQLKIRER